MTLPSLSDCEEQKPQEPFIQLLLHIKNTSISAGYFGPHYNLCTEAFFGEKSRIMILFEFGKGSTDRLPTPQKSPPGYPAHGLKQKNRGFHLLHGKQ